MTGALDARAACQTSRYQAWLGIKREPKASIRYLILVLNDFGIGPLDTRIIGTNPDDEKPGRYAPNRLSIEFAAILMQAGSRVLPKRQAKPFSLKRKNGWRTQAYSPPGKVSQFAETSNVRSRSIADASTPRSTKLTMTPFKGAIWPDTET